ncbi:hypothetical protein AVEN_257693-1 [Araneus ventricosus]|uniref:FCP1 homology domain-containing protein n=1 Tax=Araneus ventricosus TaxID=182803 RepID=A0A4Y2LGP6_ARAVE|nr:hypothetical protein AVEN_257693-1 [Araneus ventricosus]
MNQKYVCVLDMDETLGFSSGDTFHVRPKLKTLLNLLRLIRADIILWSMGTDEYVQRTVNGFLPEISTHAYKLFARTECQYSQTFYRYKKASNHIRHMYPYSIFLIAVDDLVSENMDEHYDLRIHVPPYNKVNSCDKELVFVCEKIVNGIMELSNQDV